jgi:hypothetical protein
MVDSKSAQPAQFRRLPRNPRGRAGGPDGQRSRSGSREPARASWTLLGRHQSLRTRLRLEPDGRTRQVCSAAGEFRLLVVETGGQDPAAGQVSLDDRRGRPAAVFQCRLRLPARLAPQGGGDLPGRPAGVDGLGLAAHGDRCPSAIAALDHDRSPAA